MCRPVFPSNHMHVGYFRLAEQCWQHEPSDRCACVCVCFSRGKGMWEGAQGLAPYLTPLPPLPEMMDGDHSLTPPFSPLR